MEYETNVLDENSNYQEEEVLETSVDEQDESESVDEYKARLAKAEELANNYKIRAEKAERLAKQPKTGSETKATKQGELSSKDIYALMESKVPKQDIDKVQEIATIKGITISEALELPITRQILSDELEQRTTANASNTNASRRSSNKVSDEALLSNASKGQLPDNDADLERLIKARKGYKK